ncbi:unnamed protein product, partial [Brassica rapa subsp. trilocularis]
MEVEGEDEFREEYACPFCSDYFDIVSLCCHIDDDHCMDTINGVNISLFCCHIDDDHPMDSVIVTSV